MKCFCGRMGAVNTGERENDGVCSGKAVRMLFVGAPDGRLEKPRRVLAAFEKTASLAPNGTETLTLSADPLIFASYDEAHSCYILEPGVYTLWLGDSLASVREIGTFTIEQETVLKTVHPVARPVEPFHRLTKVEQFVLADSEIVPLEQRFPVPAERKPFEPASLSAGGKRRVMFSELRHDPAPFDAFIAQLSDAELCRLNVSAGADWHMPWGKGTAGSTPKMAKYGLPAVRISDGNTGLNIVRPNIGLRILETPQESTTQERQNECVGSKTNRASTDMAG